MFTYNLPQPLQQEFERVAQSLYDHDSTQQALIEAIELWLIQQRRQRLQSEARLNNQFFETVKNELEHNYAGQWVMIAEGKVQGVADHPEKLNDLAPTALHRIIVPLGQARPKEVELGWQMTFA